MALSVVKKARAKPEPRLQDWQTRLAQIEARRKRWIERDAAAFERHLAHCRQIIIHSPDIPPAEKRRLSKLSDSELKMYLAELHQKQKLNKPTRHDPHQNKPWLPGYDSLYL